MPYEPDPEIMREDEVYTAEEASATVNPEKSLIDLGFENVNPPPPVGGTVNPMPMPLPYNPPPLPSMPPSGSYPNQFDYVGPSKPPHQPSMPQNPPMNQLNDPNQSDFPPPPNYDSVFGTNTNKGAYPGFLPPKDDGKPKPTPRSNIKNDIPELPSVPNITLPDVPSDSENNDSKDDNIDFDDLAKRFEELKKRK